MGATEALSLHQAQTHQSGAPRGSQRHLGPFLGLFGGERRG